MKSERCVSEQSTQSSPARKNMPVLSKSMQLGMDGMRKYKELNFASIGDSDMFSFVNKCVNLA